MLRLGHVVQAFSGCSSCAVLGVALLIEVVHCANSRTQTDDGRRAAYAGFGGEIRRWEPDLQASEVNQRLETPSTTVRVFGVAKSGDLLRVCAQWLGRMNATHQPLRHWRSEGQSLE